MPPARRFAAIVLPRLLCELASHNAPPKNRPRPFVVVLQNTSDASQPLREQAPIDDVDALARRLGLRPGMTITEACAFVSNLDVCVVQQTQVNQALMRIADIAMAFSPTVSIAHPDTVHIDLSGASNLAGGEAALAQDLHDRVSQVGHLPRIVIADGPKLAGALARHGASAITIVEVGSSARALRDLPVCALPLDPETASWLMRAGVITVEHLRRLPRDQLTTRLGADAPQVLALLEGHDPAPLTPYEPARVLREEASWEEGVEQQSALLFVIKRLATCIAARLEGRGEAANALTLTLELDRAVARLRRVEPVLLVHVQLPAPIHHADDLLRTLKSKLETLQVPAPVVGMVLEVPHITRAPKVQLDLSRDVTASPDALPVLLAELTAELGDGRVGTLQLVDSYRPERRSMLVAIDDPYRAASAPSQTLSLGCATTRLLPSPLRIEGGALGRGQVLVCAALGPVEVQAVQLDARLEAIEWWTPSPLSRDYVRVWLNAPNVRGWAWVYIDRRTGDIRVHGWLD